MFIPRTRQFWAVAYAHFALDTVTSSIPVQLVFISIYVLPLTPVQIGLISGLALLLSAVTQPLFGLLTDRFGGRWTGAIGLGWTAGLMVLGLLAAENGQALPAALCFVATALGSGAFHPAGMKYAAESQPSHEAGSMAWFFLFGQLGLAFGPALVGSLLNQAVPAPGLFSATPWPASLLRVSGSALPAAWAALLSLPGVALMLLYLPGRRANRAAKTSASSTARRRLALPVILLFLAMVCLRSLGHPGAVTFIPLLFQQKGWTPAEYGFITSLFWVGSGLAGVFLGDLADRYDRRHIIVISLLCSAPAFFLLPAVDGLPAFALALFAGTFIGASHSIIVVLVQGYLPTSRAMASGAALGLVFGTGALASAFIGWLAGQIGLETSFHLVAGAIVLSALLTLLLPAQPAEVAPARN